MLERLGRGRHERQNNSGLPISFANFVAGVEQEVKNKENIVTTSLVGKDPMTVYDEMFMAYFKAKK